MEALTSSSKFLGGSVLYYVIHSFFTQKKYIYCVAHNVILRPVVFYDSHSWIRIKELDEFFMLLK